MPTCSSCSGTGSYTWTDTGTRHTCLMCNGTGFIVEKPAIGGSRGGGRSGPRGQRRSADPVTNTVRLLTWLIAGLAAWFAYKSAQTWIHAAAAFLVVGVPLSLAEKSETVRGLIRALLTFAKWAALICLIILAMVLFDRYSQG